MKMLTWKDVLSAAQNGSPAPVRIVKKTDEEWRALLPAEVYRITRQHGTEKPFSSEMCQLFKQGLYACACCDTLLFNADEKFESGTGWPSFTQPYTDNCLKYVMDHSYGMVRVEVQCLSCEAHLGHVFPDGPPPTGLRFCINALALNYSPP